MCSSAGIIDLTRTDSSDLECAVCVSPKPKRIKLEPADNKYYDRDCDNGSALSESVYAPTSAFTQAPAQPNTVMVVTEGRGIASEIAYCLLDLATSRCTVSQYADGPSYSRTIYTMVTSRPQTVLAPQAMVAGKSKAMLNIRRYLPWLVVSPLERRWFNDKDGMQLLRELVALDDSQLGVLERNLYRKQYAYSALNALFHYVQAEMGQTFARGSVHIDCKQMQGTMLIDPRAWQDLSLVDGCVADGRSPWSLLRAIDHTLTPMGSRLLRANILQPSTDLGTIYARQMAVADLLDNEERFFRLSATLPDVPDIDAAITLLVRAPASSSTLKQTSSAIGNVLRAKHILQMAGQLATALDDTAPLRSSLLAEIARALTDNRIAELLACIHEVVREGVTLEKSAQMSRSQRCHAVKDGVDGFLDVSRAIFDKVTQEVVDLVEQYSSEAQIPIRAVYKPSTGYIMTARRDMFEDAAFGEFTNVAAKKNTVTFTSLELVKLNNRLSSVVTEINLLTEKAIDGIRSLIRDNVALLYRISEAVGLLDMLLSFAQHCTICESVAPVFSDSIKIDDGRHPILEAIGKDAVVANSVSTVDARFTLVSGPNMGGKSTYLRQIVYTVVMAQIGSYVPARSASLVVFDRLFVRMNNGDSLASSESTFVREMHDLAYILRSCDEHSLVVIDELGRSTATDEGKAICRAVCEQFISAANRGPTVFLTTHFLDLALVLGESRHCTRVALSSSLAADDGDGESGLNEEEPLKGTVSVAHGRFKASVGAQLDPMYGIRLAESMGVPQEIICTARQVAGQRVYAS
ncbi:MutS protein msh4 [Coemansia sp. RSA 2599]|nr:MutS protein msh4 [Coemansia sp. RSA 2598]KAJ1829671.1 MutS protein msh4 [Coemansia sp. RSA 2599]